MIDLFVSLFVFVVVYVVTKIPQFQVKSFFAVNLYFKQKKETKISLLFFRLSTQEKQKHNDGRTELKNAQQFELNILFYMKTALK